MYRFLEYLLLFVLLLLLQILFFSRIGVSLYLHPLIYIAFVVLLPMEIPGALLLLLGFATGVVMDLFMGMAGVNTIATLTVAFSRPLLLLMCLSKDEVKEGGVPNVKRMGERKFLRYTVMMVLLQSAIFFLLEALSWHLLLHVLLRIVLSSVITVAFIYLFQRFFRLSGAKH